MCFCIRCTCGNKVRRGRSLVCWVRHVYRLRNVTSGVVGGKGCLRLEPSERLCILSGERETRGHATLSPLLPARKIENRPVLPASLPELFAARVPLCQPGIVLEFIGLVNKAIPPRSTSGFRVLLSQRGRYIPPCLRVILLLLLPQSTCLNKEKLGGGALEVIRTVIHRNRQGS